MHDGVHYLHLGERSVSVFAASILGGAYKGKDIAERMTLRHAVSDMPFAIGRIKRDDGEAFCDRKYSTATTLADSFSWQEATEVTCPRCLEILRRYRRMWP